MQRLAPAVLAGVLPRLYPQMLEIAYEHQDAGRPIFICTAASQEMAELMAIVLTFDGAIGSVSEVVDGAYTGREGGQFTYREGKAQAIREFAERESIDLDASYAYTDSESDLPMLRLVGHPVAVNPDAELGRIALRGGLGDPALRPPAPPPADGRRARRRRSARRRRRARLARRARPWSEAAEPSVRQRTWPRGSCAHQHATRSSRWIVSLVTRGCATPSSSRRARGRCAGGRAAQALVDIRGVPGVRAGGGSARLGGKCGRVGRGRTYVGGIEGSRGSARIAPWTADGVDRGGAGPTSHTASGDSAEPNFSKGDEWACGM